MSDYINRQEAIDRLSEVLSSEAEFEIAKQVIIEAPTLSETEIIRKAFERVVERLEENGQKMSEAKATRPYAKHSPADHRYYKAISVKKAIEIVKEECGINERD